MVADEEQNPLVMIHEDVEMNPASSLTINIGLHPNLEITQSCSIPLVITLPIELWTFVYRFCSWYIFGHSQA